MGLLIDGVWRDAWYDTGTSGGRFERQASHFRSWITPAGSPGPTGQGGFPAVAGRYHLYVSLACPWAHRTLIARALAGLEAAISVDVVDPIMLAEGWTFDSSFPGATGDRVNGKRRLYEIYLLADPRYTGRVTVPVLWDKHRRTIVNNESSEIMRMLASAFGREGAGGPDLYPTTLRAEIDAINARVYADVNNGVYRCGFATSQEAYEEAFHTLFATLDWLEARLASRRYLAGATPTEADWRLFTTLVRFDAVYVGHFKCNLRRIADYPALSGYLRDLYQQPGIAPTVALDHIKSHYFASHRTINPTGIIPIGPVLDWEAPHGRSELAA